MTYPTTPVFITQTTGWDKARAHPAMAWMEKCTDAWDSRQSWSTPYTDWVTDDFTFVKPNGERCTGGEPAWDAMKLDYAAFKLSHHEPSWVCVVDLEDGWEFIGEGKLYIDLPEEGKEEKTVYDLDGRPWDLGVESMFRFRFVKTESAVNDGIRIRRFQFYSDSGPVLAEMLKREIVRPQDLLG
ncbi:uncharacterized protein BO97DRAFT_460634 [Aspergillus homomorphus CBS 101889]|uniref:SnoaL-like domain-containing protein n=1 Tax=Aspergillus homomorphus (strain CBS 101889) TaxID=1450537 RepID=A0A395HNW7_ASPHC|nr:hypothetical protein BO97DRAFT_460634 [Aspergillus homomorphus CBS 101889]RAL08538.1 hypothetical protein BO97DRAFT_460634 [Aspergillus homomorphus CBS 101889]